MNRFRMPSIALLPIFALAVSAATPPPAVAQPAVQRVWSDKFDTVNVMVHACLLPNGKVLFWSRREAGEGLDPINALAVPGSTFLEGPDSLCQRPEFL
jgi:hypothetical protein